MKKILSALFAVLIIASLLILSGVNGCQQKQGTAVSTTGLEISFVKDAPPVSISVNQEFPIYIDVLNKGAEFINKGGAKFYLNGLQNFDNINPSQSNTKMLTKESVYADRIVFADKAKYNFPLQAMSSIPFALTACYDYSGKAQGVLCISKSNESKICQTSGEKLTSSTAGPIQVTSITESISGNKLTAVFNIANKDDGQVFLLNMDCDRFEAKDFAESLKQGKLNVKLTTKEDFKCKLISTEAPYGQIEGLNGAIPLGSVVCEKMLTNEDYASPLVIEMKYKYRDSIGKSITIFPTQ